MDVYDLAEKAAEEMAAGSTTDSHRKALLDRFVQVQAQRKREERRVELTSCSSQFVNLIVTVMVGITTLALLALLLRQIFGG